MSLPTALVTGASRGIGRAIALNLLRTHQVIATYRGNHEAAESLRSEAGPQAQLRLIQSDISSAADRANLVEHLRSRFPRLDLLVNNAGIAPRERRDVLEATEDSLDELLATNLKGPHFLTQSIANWMLEHKTGRIVFITSISAFAVSTPRADYCMSKAALSMSAQAYAARLAPDGIGVFEIQPGVIRTDMIAKVQQAYEERIANGLVPQRRLGEGEDIAKAVRAIADGLLDYCAGQILNVDGGFHLRTL
jgi:NAD(P)-dependent dehydrogenase (short-subunit alcohol dehydrogenase family)